jgi:aerobic-type carbon monoxide dehydrogenase small subunit (CoxS/CutS family)
MADDAKPPQQATPEDQPPVQEGRPPSRVLTRRDFLVRSNAGAVAVGVMSGITFAATLDQQSPRPAKPQQPSAAPMKTRQLTLDIDGRKREVTVDVRESLWETLNYQLGLSNANLGCDRAQCGACTVLVDGRPVTSCSVLTARLGRGQKILTVSGITRGPGLDGLHPVQRAFWFEGGFQCGICTRGFIMSAYALLERNTNPSDAEIKEALSGNICRCGEYVGIMSAVKKAAAEMRGEQVSYTASLQPVTAGKPAAAPAGESRSKQFQFATPLGTIEVYDEIALELKQTPGILAVAGSELTITITWDSARLDEARVRQLLAQSGHPVR